MSTPLRALGLCLVLLAGLLGFRGRTAAATATLPPLLTADDAGDGWSASASAPASAFSYAWCPEVRAALPAPTARGALEMTGQRMSDLLYHEVMMFGGGDAQQAFSKLWDGDERCSWDEKDADAIPMTFTLGAAHALAFGEEAALRTLNARWDGAALAAEIVVIRRGDMLAVVTNVALGEGSAAVNHDLTMALAARVDGRLRQAAESAAGAR